VVRRQFESEGELSNGKKEPGRKGKTQAALQGTIVQPLSALRTLASVPQEVWGLQDLFQGTGASGRDPGSPESQLVKGPGSST